MTRRLALLLILVAVSSFGGAAALLAQQEATVDAVSREVQAAQDQLASVSAEFEGPRQSRSIVLLDEIVARLATLQASGGLPPRGRDMLALAYELRGRAYYGIGLQEKATESFRLLIQLKPDYALSKERVSPKVVDLYAAVKKALVGYLAVSSRPQGAVVTISGPTGRSELGLTDFFPMEVVAGEYTVEVNKEGYRSESRAVSIASRATEALQFDLTRTTASAFFVTQPAAVEIWIDGTLKTATAGSPPPDLAAAVRALGMDPAQTSGRIEVPGLTLGSHVVEFRKKCHETVRSTIEAGEARDYDIQPVRLEESTASLRLTSDPPGARIFINGEARGLTPAQVDGVCSGRVRVEVKHQAGRFIQELALQKNDAVSLECPIRPSLAFLGVIPETPSAAAIAGDVEDKIRENLARLSSFNFINVPQDTVDRLLDAERIDRRALVSAEERNADLLRRATERLATALEVQGFLIAYLPGERLQRNVALRLLAAGNGEAESWDVVFNESASYGRFIAALDQKVPIQRPWSGLITVDTRLHEGLPVLRVVAESPAAKAGIQPGDIVEAVDGRTLKATAELRDAIGQRRAGDRLALHLRGPSGPRTVELVLGETPQEIPLFDSKLLYNAVMVDLRQKVEGYPGTERAALARLNLGLAAMHFGDFALAHDYLQKAKVELPQRSGVSQGTALYYLGVALERLGYQAQAAEAYRAAATQKGATLFDNDGPAVAPIAARRAGPVKP